MTLARIVVTGKVTKNPEKRFTQNNLAVASLIVDVNPQDETLVRVTAIGTIADRIAETISMGDSVIVDGRLQMETVKTTNGKERKVATINASSVEKIGETSQTASVTYKSAPQKNEQNAESVVQFSTEEIAEDLIDPDEIPF